MSRSLLCLPLRGLALCCIGTGVLQMAAAQDKPAPPARAGGVFVLDDSDPQFRGKEKYADNLTYLDPSGKVVFRVSGLNNCETIGSNHMVAVDPARGWVWVVELVGHTIRKYDRSGKQLLVLKDIRASALAVDPDTGNLWAVTSKGTIYGDKTVVFDPQGKQLAVHDLSGFDIAYDPKGKAFWVAGPNLSRIPVAGKDTIVVEGIAAWCASSVAVDPRSGKVWVAVRRHPQVHGSNNELYLFDNEGRSQKRIDLGDHSPFRVSIDPRDGAVWVTLMRHSVRRYSADGRLQAEHKLHALACAADPASGGVWVVTPGETLRLDRKGQVKARARHRANTDQAWIAGG